MLPRCDDSAEGAAEHVLLATGNHDTGSRAARGNDLRAGIVQQRAAGEPAGEDGLLAAVVDNTAKISAADQLAAAARDRGTDRDATGADVHDAGVERGGICNATALNVECAPVDCRVDGRTVVVDQRCRR